MVRSDEFTPTHPASTGTSRAYWVDAPGRGGLRPTPVGMPGPGRVGLRATHSGISPGTERLVGLGLVPTDAVDAMACRGMQGSFALPVLYGYSLVGEVLDGRHAGQLAFTMHPHQERVVVEESALVPLPPGLPPARATLLPNLETALNAVWDAELQPDEKAAVVGAGAVGSLLTFVLAAAGHRDVVIADNAAERRRRAAALPWSPRVLVPEQLTPGAFACVFHATGSGHGLQLGIDALGFEGRLIELSWYGERPVTLRLGGRFHWERQRIVGSQVATVARSHRAEGRAARTHAVLELLADDRLDALLDAPVPFAELPRFFARLYAGELLPPCPHVIYP